MSNSAQMSGLDRMQSLLFYMNQMNSHWDFQVNDKNAAQSQQPKKPFFATLEAS